jgi:hypothetical protein
MGMKKRIFLSEGDRFNQLTVIKEVNPIKDKRGYPRRMILCSCDCGIKKEIQLGSLRNGTAGSCGHTHTTHKMTGTRLYKVFESMKSRCINKANSEYHRYGGRGIVICKEWLDDPCLFFEWAKNNGYKKELEIDRVNNDDGYYPSNCRFVTSRQNSLNRSILQPSNTSGYAGIGFNKKKWQARIMINHKAIHIGRFITKKQAVDARNDYITANHLEQDYAIQPFRG